MLGERMKMAFTPQQRSSSSRPKSWRIFTASAQFSVAYWHTGGQRSLVFFRRCAAGLVADKQDWRPVERRAVENLEAASRGRREATEEVGSLGVDLLGCELDVGSHA